MVFINQHLICINILMTRKFDRNAILFYNNINKNVLNGD